MENTIRCKDARGKTSLSIEIERKYEVSKGVVLLSGGLDSAVTAYQANGEVDKLYALTFRYGQVHSKEVECALQLGLILGAERHKVLDLPLDMIGGSSLVGVGDIPKEPTQGIPSTWVPQRNAIFLSVAFAWAEVVGADKVYIGVNSVDYSGYPDCRPEFIGAVEKALNLASKRFVEGGTGISIETPIIHLSKKKIVELGLKLKVPFERTWSCYAGGDRPCRVCDSCRIRARAFEECSIEDPLVKGG